MYTCKSCNGEGYLPVSNEEAENLNISQYRQIFTKAGKDAQKYIMCTVCCGSGKTRSPF